MSKKDKPCGKLHLFCFCRQIPAVIFAVFLPLRRIGPGNEMFRQCAHLDAAHVDEAHVDAPVGEPVLVNAMPSDPVPSDPVRSDSVLVNTAHTDIADPTTQLRIKSPMPLRKTRDAASHQQRPCRFQGQRRFQARRAPKRGAASVSFTTSNDGNTFFADGRCEPSFSESDTPRRRRQRRCRYFRLNWVRPLRMSWEPAGPFRE